jgi:hypothetical protein
VLIAFFYCGNLFAQERIPITGNKRINLDSIFTNQQPTVPSSNRMPNALEGFKDNQQIMGNNKQGFDIYQSQVDNMAVLRPDASNAASFKMPNDDRHQYLMKKMMENNFYGITFTGDMNTCPPKPLYQTIFPGTLSRLLPKLKKYKLPE